MIQSISKFFTQVVHRVLPDPLIFAILLTLVTFGLAIGLTPKTPSDLILLWGSGFWNLGLRVEFSSHSSPSIRTIPVCRFSLVRRGNHTIWRSLTPFDSN